MFIQANIAMANFVFWTIFELVIIKSKIIAILLESKLKRQAFVCIREEITSSAYINNFAILGGRCIHKQVGYMLLKRAMTVTLCQVLTKHPDTPFTYSAT